MSGRRLKDCANDCNASGLRKGAPIDRRVADAIAHWKPRFTANGVSPPDFETITAGLERWEDWPEAWCAGARVHEDLGREALEQGRWLSAGAHLAQAAVYYHFAKFVFVEDLATMRAAHRRAVRCLNDALPHLDPSGRRVEIPFEGAKLVGVLRRPPMAEHVPLVILIPGLDSAKEEFRPTEELFLQRGLATLSLDGPGQGEAEYDLPIRPDWETPIGAVIDHVAGLDGIDPAAVGLWGVSLGGYYAPRAASGDPRVRACIALAGPYDFGEVWERLPGLTRATFATRSRASSEQEARHKASELSLAGRADEIACPLQVVMGKLDRLIPWEHAQRLAEQARGPTDLLLLEDGNHGCANVAAKHRYRSADWMARVLGAAPPAAT
jgi:2,6-dihydroxypseudooxynicotine hydrolase